MQLEFIDWLIIIVFFIISFGISFYYKNQASKSLSDFFLGGRNLPWYIAGISMVATTFAADTPLAVTEIIYKNGVSGNWIWWNFLAGGMLTTFFFANLWRKSGVLTEVELIELRYSGLEAAILRGFKAIYLGLFMNIMIIGWVNLALVALLKVFFGLSEFEALIATACAMLFVAVYSSISGLKGIAITDTLQFVIAMAGTIILAIIVVNSDAIGGIEGLKSKLPRKDMLNFFPTINNDAGEGNYSLTIKAFIAFIAIQWWASWYPGAEPGGGGYIAQRMMSTKNEKHAVWSTLFFQIGHYCIRPWPWILVGLCAVVLYPDLADRKLGYAMAMKDFLPTGLKGLLLTAFFAAYMSTISTQLNWGASYIVNDFYQRFMNPGASQSKLVLTSRITTLLLMGLAMIITTLITSISGVWEFIIQCGAGLGLVLILRWYWWRINAWSEIAAMIVPFLTYAVTTFAFDLQFTDSFLVTVGVTTVSWIIITFITPPTQQGKLLSFYKQVTPDGFWKPVTDQLKIEKPESQLPQLFVCWISAIVLGYSLLFGTGKVLLKEWSDAGIYFTLAVTSLLTLNYFLKRTRIFKKEKLKL